MGWRGAEFRIGGLAHARLALPRTVRLRSGSRGGPAVSLGSGKGRSMEDAMSRHRPVPIVPLTLAFLLLAAAPAGAVPTTVTHNNSASCDDLLIPFEVDEIGIAPAFDLFPDERITASATATTLSACSLIPDDPGTPNALVSIVNTTGRAFSALWYVADTAGPGGGTLISNQDGFADDAVAGSGFGGGQAFRIDTVGANQPLVSESLNADGILEIGETWHFVIQDYLSFGGIGADAFSSVGLATASGSGGPSSGSLIGIAVVPEPALAALLLAGLLGAVGLRPRL